MRDTRNMEAVGFLILSGREANEIRGKRLTDICPERLVSAIENTAKGRSLHKLYVKGCKSGVSE